MLIHPNGNVLIDKILSFRTVQAFGFFNEVIVEKCFGLLKMLGLGPTATSLKAHEQVELKIHCMTFLEDIENLLGMVSLDDYVDVKQTLIENVSTVLGLYYGNSLRGLILHFAIDTTSIN